MLNVYSQNCMLLTLKSNTHDLGQKHFRPNVRPANGQLCRYFLIARKFEPFQTESIYIYTRFLPRYLTKQLFIAP